MVVHEGKVVYVPVGRLEIQNGRPVVAEIFAKRTRCARALLANVALHAGVEGIPADDVVEMGRADDARLDDGVQALHGERGASEAEGGLDGRGERQGEREGLHRAWRGGWVGGRGRGGGRLGRQRDSRGCGHHDGDIYEGRWSRGALGYSAGDMCRVTEPNLSKGLRRKSKNQ